MIYYYSLPQMGQDRKENRKEQTAAARRLLRYGLWLEYGLETLPEIALESQGKPCFPKYSEIQFNYSHCRKGILCGIDGAAIGVDIETVRAYREALAKRICHERELAFIGQAADKPLALTTVWVAKEAYLKCVGSGLRCDLRALDLLEVLEHGTGSCGGFQIVTRIVDGCCAAVCSEKVWDRQLLCVKEENV